MNAKELLEGIEYEVVSGDPDTEVAGVSRDNREAKAGDLFICTAGARFDTHDEAVIRGLFDKGVRAFVTGKETVCPEGALMIRVKDTRAAGACIYAAWYGHPAREMTVIGITGSKGKTTTAHMLAGILRAAGHTVGTLGTNGAETPAGTYELSNTTPESEEVQKYLREMADQGCDAAVIEVSSQGMKQHRVDGFTFDYGIWMNIQEGDHVGPNEHETFEDYIYCKAQLLNHSRVRLVHRDDPYREKLMEFVDGPVLWFGGSEGCDYRASEIRKTFDEARGVPGISFRVSGKLQGESWINLPGDFNVWNALAAMAAADRMGVSLPDMNKALGNIRIRGRDDMVYRGEFSVCVDFAHNGASTWHHLSALREFRPKRLICVFGADGNRSKGRRYGMGEAAGTLADFSVVTSGHNRWESFEQILADTEVGLKKAPDPHYIAIKDRKEAIRYVIGNALPGDLITIIGLGHESWQEENGVKTPYSDIDFVREVLREKGLI